MKTEPRSTPSAWIAHNAEVSCSGRRFGRVTGVVLEPKHFQLTHLIVRERGLIGIERIVPVHLVRIIETKRFDLTCSRADLIQFEVVSAASGTFDEYPDPPWVIDDLPLWSHEWYNRPPLPMLDDESGLYPAILLRMGARVVAEKGFGCRVTGVMILSDSWRLTHVRIQQNQPWGHKTLSVPAEKIARIEEDAIFLDVAKAEFDQTEFKTRGIA